MTPVSQAVEAMAVIITVFIGIAIIAVIILLGVDLCLKIFRRYIE